MKVMYILDCEPSSRIFLHCKNQGEPEVWHSCRISYRWKFCCIKKPSYRSSVSNLNMVKENQEHGANTIRGTIEYFFKRLCKRKLHL